MKVSFECTKLEEKSSKEKRIMISDSYMEVMVQRKSSPVIKAGRLGLYLLTGIFIVLAIMGFAPAFLGAAGCGIGAYFLSLYLFVEYEYTYIDKELQIDRILGKSRRKRMDTLDLQQMEIMAPINSHQLHRYQGRNKKRSDYSSGEIKQPEARYLLCMNEKELILEPPKELVKMIKSVSPHKVFTY